MKNFDWKKIAIIVGIAIVLVLVLALVINNSNKEKEASKEDREIIEKLTDNYIKYLKVGNTTEYIGMDLLFSKDEIKLDDLTDGDILGMAFRYIINETDKEIITKELRLNLQLNEIDPDSYQYILKSEDIKETVKKLFGIEWENKNYQSTGTEYYNYYYNEFLDIYLQEINEKYKNINFEEIGDVYTRTLKVTKDKKEAKIKIAVAYVEEQDEQQAFYKDSKRKEHIYTTNSIEEEIREDEIERFDTYTITYKVDGDNYIFDNIKKD
ncbi:MAG: hypothetical protein ACI4WW_04680 [Candidatus Coprovivens sp.]